MQQSSTREYFTKLIQHQMEVVQGLFDFIYVIGTLLFNSMCYFSKFLQLPFNIEEITSVFYSYRKLELGPQLLHNIMRGEFYIPKFILLNFCPFLAN